MNNTSRNSNHNSFHTDRERERDGDGGGFYTGHATGSPPTNISSSTSSFYNLQMYSTPSLYTTTTPTVIPVSTNTHYQSQSQQPLNLYQNVQEVLYHPTLDHRAYPVRSSPSPSAASTGSSSSGIEYNKVHKNGITFVDPFSTPVSSSTNDNYHRQQQQLYNQRNLSNINSIRNTTSSSSISNNVRTSSETVFQPIYATFGTESIFVTCPYCHSSESTEIEQVVGSKSFLWACIIPCAGFLRKSKWDTRHRCKNCLNVIGTYYP